jgi:hypothetical protein
LEIFGDEVGLAQWSIPMHDNGKRVGAITSINNRILQVMQQFETFIDASIANEVRWNKSITIVLQSIVMLCKLCSKKRSFWMRP